MDVSQREMHIPHSHLTPDDDVDVSKEERNLLSGLCLSRSHEVLQRPLGVVALREVNDSE